jgi:hypothetical protein
MVKLKQNKGKQQLIDIIIQLKIEMCFYYQQKLEELELI